MSDLRAANRHAPTWRQILNPVWLLSDELRPAGWPWLLWFLRNPAVNLLAVVLGICHREREVVWRRGPGWTYVPVGGLNYGWSRPLGAWLWRPFISYRGTRFEVAAGWKTSGALTLLDVRRANSPNAGPQP